MVHDFNVTDRDALFADLKAKDIVFVQELDQQLWGTYAIIEDLEGNKLVLVQQPQH